MKKLHHCRLVYKDLGHKETHIPTDQLQDYISRQQKTTGLALFVDGFCRNKGYLTDDQIRLIERQLKDSPVKPKFIRNKESGISSLTEEISRLLQNEYI